jgi:hypothetical protein
MMTCSTPKEDPMTEVLDYYDMLAKHDWHYEMTEDPGVWRKGSAEHRRLLAIASESEEHRQLYGAWNCHIFSNGPKPVRAVNIKVAD